MRILRLPEVINITGLSRATIWRKECDGSFPQRVRTGENSVGWKSTEIDEWIESLPRVPSPNSKAGAA